MAIRIRIIDGHTVALCAAKTREKPGDIYIDDNGHHALTTKFGRDFAKMGHMENPPNDESLVEIMERVYAKGERV